MYNINNNLNNKMNVKNTTEQRNNKAYQAEQERLSILNNNEEKERSQQYINICKNIEKLNLIESDIKILDNTYCYNSNILLKLINDLYSKKYADKSHFNPLLEKITGYLIEYYKEQINMSFKLDIMTKLNTIESNVNAIILKIKNYENNTNTTSYKITQYIKEMKLLKDLYFTDVITPLMQNIVELINKYKKKENNINADIIHLQNKISINQTLSNVNHSIDTNLINKHKIYQIILTLKKQQLVFVGNMILFLKTQIQDASHKKKQIGQNLVSSKIKDFLEFKMLIPIKYIENINIDIYIKFRTDDCKIQEDIIKEWNMSILIKLQSLKYNIYKLRQLITYKMHHNV
jgi:hypothetical protein